MLLEKWSRRSARNSYSVSKLKGASAGIPSQQASIDPVTRAPGLLPLAVVQPTVHDGCQYPSSHSATGSSTVPLCGLEHARL